jgi:effector-binding domain-containing protein
MKKTGFIILFIIVISAILFIPVTRQNNISINASFFNTYQHLTNANNWKKWRSDVHQAWLTDSTKINISKTSKGFNLNYSGAGIQVTVNGYSLLISETGHTRGTVYTYIVFPNSNQNKTDVTVIEETNVLHYLLNLNRDQTLSDTHVTDLQHFMEDPDLYYGYHIVKRKVSDTAIILLKRTVLANYKFDEAKKSLFALQAYLAAHGLKQTQPLMAQFLPKSTDSMLVRVGIPVDKKAVSASPVEFVHMPQTGSLYTVRFHGKFKERISVYAAVQRFFKDKQLPMPILPFENYLDNKLPANENDTVNIQLNFTTF